jgi:hypothetical protein
MLYSFSKDRLIYVKEFLSLSSAHDAFQMPLSVEAFDEYNELQDILVTLTKQKGDDIWSWKYNKGIYASSSFYK